MPFCYHRELVPLAPYPSFLVPTLVHSSDEGFHDPEDILVESLVEEQDVRVVLGHVQAVDARAEPIISPWTLVAFRKGESWEGKRHHAEVEVQEEHERRRSTDALGETEEKLRTMRVSGVGQLHSLITMSIKRVARGIEWSGFAA